MFYLPSRWLWGTFKFANHCLGSLYPQQDSIPRGWACATEHCMPFYPPKNPKISLLFPFKTYRHWGSDMLRNLIWTWSSLFQSPYYWLLCSSAFSLWTGLEGPRMRIFPKAVMIYLFNKHLLAASPMPDHILRYYVHCSISFWSQPCE